MSFPLIILSFYPVLGLLLPQEIHVNSVLLNPWSNLMTISINVTRTRYLEECRVNFKLKADVIRGADILPPVVYS